ncbi:MAG: CBS domain-containing protein [Pseudomonadota bacterium]
MMVANILATKGRSVTTASQANTISDICTVLAEKKIGAVVVLGDDERIAGIVSERDIVRAFALNGAAALDQAVSTVMTADVVACHEGDTINDVMGKMTEGRFRHVPVTENDHLVGLVSIGDVVKAKIAQIEADAEQLRSYIASA